jgi:hypothetical protein
MNLKGFPHSDIPGSKLVCSSPGLIAAYRVLHRLLAPRHSPYALSSLTTSVSSSHRLWALGFWLSAHDHVNSISSHTACCLPSQLETARDESRTAAKRFARQRVRKELPFAGYSVVKEPTGLWALGFWLWSLLTPVFKLFVRLRAFGASSRQAVNPRKPV